jgi:hypothetical protein
MAKLNKNQKTLLARIKEASEAQEEPRYLMLEESDADLIALKENDPDHIEFAEELRQGTMIAVHFNDNPAPKPNGAAAMLERETILANHPLFNDFPMQTKRGVKGEQYPFKFMEVGQSFVIPASKEKAEPWVSFGSTVTSATRRYKDEGKVFRLRRVTAGDTYPNGAVETTTGARVYRVQ